MTAPRLARVALPAPRGGTFTYVLPETLPVPGVGCRVLVPFGRGERVGFMEGPEEDPPEGVSLRAVVDVIDDACPFPAELLRFAGEAARYYMVPRADLLKLAVAAVPWLDPRSVLRPSVGGPAGGPSALPGLGSLSGSLADRVLASLARRPLRVGTIRTKLGTAGLSRALSRLVAQGSLEILEPSPRCEAPLRPVGGAGEEGPPAGPPVLSEEQSRAVTELLRCLDAPAPRPVLVHGVTASGKTEVYLHLMRAALARGKGVLFLAPEIALSEALLRVVRRGLGHDVAVLHSGMTEAARRRAFEDLREGSVRVALGPRSALFAPVRDLGLVVVDEEHEPSFKSQQHPRVHARDMAVLRGHLCGALVILGSATPSVESYERGRQGKYGLLELRSRARGGPMPEVRLVDMREEFLRTGHPVLLSEELVALIRDALGRGQQGLLLLNRRGYATLLLCRGCGQSVPCKSCSQGMTYHRAMRTLLCHLCGYRRSPPVKCPGCGGEILELRGAGTERLLAEAVGLFPEARPLRVDSDLSARQVARALAAFEAHESGLLVGTQMIAKGHDFANVSVVGVLGADAGLTLPDYRGAERTFALLTQVAGRAGRGSAGGVVVMQCWNPGHYALQTACRQDYGAFFAQEIRVRSALLQPPRAAMALLLCCHAREDRAAALAQHVADRVRRTGERVSILGPAPAFRARVMDIHRWQVLVKSRARAALRAALLPVAAEAQDPRGTFAAGGGTVLLDLDPVDLL